MACVDFRLLLFVSTGTDTGRKADSTFSPVWEHKGCLVVLYRTLVKTRLTDRCRDVIHKHRATVLAYNFGLSQALVVLTIRTFFQFLLNFQV